MLKRHVRDEERERGGGAEEGSFSSYRGLIARGVLLRRVGRRAPIRRFAPKIGFRLDFGNAARRAAKAVTEDNRQLLHPPSPLERSLCRLTEDERLYGKEKKLFGIAPMRPAT